MQLIRRVKTWQVRWTRQLGDSGPQKDSWTQNYTRGSKQVISGTFCWKSFRELYSEQQLDINEIVNSKIVAFAKLLNNFVWSSKALNAFIKNHPLIFVAYCQSLIFSQGGLLYDWNLLICYLSFIKEQHCGKNIVCYIRQGKLVKQFFLLFSFWITTWKVTLRFENLTVA